MLTRLRLLAPFWFWFLLVPAINDYKQNVRAGFIYAIICVADEQTLKKYKYTLIVEIQLMWCSIFLKSTAKKSSQKSCDHKNAEFMTDR